MIVLAATALGSGVITGIVLMPVSHLAALVAAPVVASLATVLAAAALARRSVTAEPSTLDLDARTDAMVAALRGIAGRAEPTSHPHPHPEDRRAAG